MHREARISNYVLASFSIVSLTLLSLPIAAPVQAFKICVTYVLNPVAYYGAKGQERLASVPARIRGLLSADIENRLMHEEIQEALWVRAQMEALKAENGRLRSTLGLGAPKGHAPLWAHVMERDPLHWYRSLMVDKGGLQGVSLNAPVLGEGPEGLVAIGRVVEVRPKTSVVLLVSDELSSVAAYLSSSTLEGLVQGQGGSRLLMNYLSSEATLQVGERVYTSPTSATFPPDILMGTVVKVNPRDPFLTFQSAEIQAAVEAASLKTVMILRLQEAAPMAGESP